MIDTGILGEPLEIVPDISHQELAEFGGTTLEALRNAGARGRAVEQMRDFVKKKVTQLWADGLVLGGIGLGGAEGAVMSASALMSLPFGVPKLVLSPIASGRHLFHPLVGTSDMMLMHTVVDILGLNQIATAVFDNAAAAMAGMVQAKQDSPNSREPTRDVAITMLGNTTTSTMAMREVLAAEGYQGVVFHANGIGGPAMEELIQAGRFVGVIDLTISELVGDVMGGVHVGGDERLRSAARLGLPQIVVPGCAEFAVFPPDSIPEKYKARPSYYHNPEFALVRADLDEMLKVAELITDRINGATGPTAVVIPTEGLSIPNRPGGEFYDPETDAIFTARLLELLREDIPAFKEAMHVNDPEFGRVVARHFMKLVSAEAGVLHE